MKKTGHLPGIFTTISFLPAPKHFTHVHRRLLQHLVPDMGVDYIDTEHFSAAMGMRNALGGVIGFLVTVLGSRILTAIQANENSLFGFPIYAQQVLSLLTCTIMIAAVFYTRTVIKKLPKLLSK